MFQKDAPQIEIFKIYIFSNIMINSSRVSLDKSNNHVKRHDECSKNALNIKDVDVFVFKFIERNNYIYITKP